MRLQPILMMLEGKQMLLQRMKKAKSKKRGSPNPIL